jgi:excisionase family DNA binding protein
VQSADCRIPGAVLKRLPQWYQFPLDTLNVPFGGTIVPKAVKPSAEDLFSRPLLTKEEIGRFLHLSERTLERYMSARKIPYLKLGGGAVRFRLIDVERALKRYKIEEVSL